MSRAPTRGDARGAPVEASEPVAAAGVLVLRTNLANWSELVHATSALHRLAGVALARAMDGNEPTPTQVAELRRLLREAARLLAAGVAMDARAAPDPKTDVGSFASMPAPQAERREGG